MSNIIKLHSPGGNVRIIRRRGGANNSNSGSISVGGDSSSNAGNSPSASAGMSTFEEQREITIDQQMKDEFKAGFDEGRRFSEKVLHDELAAKELEQTRRIELLIQNITTGYQELQNSAERNVVKLALAIAERIVKREVQRDDDFVLRQIHEATKRVIGVERIKIRVSPADVELVRGRRAQVLATTEAVRDLAIEGDETIERGGCVIESDSGNVDALIATQLERIEAAILGQQGGK